MTGDIFDPAMSEALDDLRRRDEAFAIATVIRTAGATAAKPGARAVLRADGTILQGWLGGGCTRGAVKAAVLQALADGQPQMISVAPEDVLSERGLRPGAVVDGVQFARNGCPSRGTIDLFIEPCLPQPALVIFGTSPVAQALCELGLRFDWAARCVAPDDTIEPPAAGRTSAIVVATQGQGDLAALKAAISALAGYVAFVGSRLKFKALCAKLAAEQIPDAQIKAVRAPAGLDIGAVTPDEIALSILAELTRIRRRALIRD